MNRKKKKTIVYVVLILLILVINSTIYSNSLSDVDIEPYEIENENLIYDESGYIKFENEVETSSVSSFSKIDDLSIIADYTAFEELLSDGKITEVYAEFNSNSYSSDFYYFTENDNYCYKTSNPLSDDFKKELLQNGVKVYGKAYIFERVGISIPFDGSEWLSYVPNLIYIGILGFFIYTMTKSQRDQVGGNEKEGVKTSQKDAKGFDDIGGLKEVKKDMLCLVDFVKDSKKYTLNGAKLPKGVLLVGPPGTGKTLIAKAIAKEADVPFLYANGSDFVEMFVGRGASRVRSLFKEARKSAPCIVFIDEIDTLCTKRVGEQGHSEDRKTLTALLTEMDGFKSDTNIMVIGATNRIEDIDEAVLRPGRFTDIYTVPLPETMEERLEIIKIYTKDKKFAEDVDFNVLAKELIGCSPAEIEAVINEGAIISVQKGLNYINKQCLDEAFYKRVMRGHQKDNKETDLDDLKIIAYHEAGHTLIAKLFGRSVTKVTILPSTSGAGGVTFIQPDDKKLKTKHMLENDVCELYGGVVAEYLINGQDWNQVTTGCSNDIEQATIILQNMIERFGMSDNGLVNMKLINKQTTNDTVSYIVEKSDELKRRTIDLMSVNIDKLNRLAEALLDAETLHEDKINEIMDIQ